MFVLLTNTAIMKTKLILTTLACSILMQLNAQVEPVAPVAPIEPVAPVEPPTAPEPPSAPNVNEDSTHLKFGNVRMIIIEEKEEKENKSDVSDTAAVAPKEKKRKKTESTWGGMYLGVNGMLTFDNKLEIPSQYEFIEIDYAKSVTVGLNFADVAIKIIPNYFTLNTGLGIQWNRYGLKNNYNLSYTADTLTGQLITGYNYEKNVLKGTYLQVPLFFEIHTSKYHKKAFHFGFGVVGGYKIGSRLKQKFEVDGVEHRVKSKGHYHLSPFQAYATARIGYGNINLFMNYGLTRIFEKGKGPQLYPVTVGIYLPFN